MITPEPAPWVMDCCKNSPVVTLSVVISTTLSAAFAAISSMLSWVEVVLESCAALALDSLFTAACWMTTPEEEDSVSFRELASIPPPNPIAPQSSALHNTSATVFPAFPLFCFF